MTQHPIAAFLTARLDELEQKALAAGDETTTWYLNVEGNLFEEPGSPVAIGSWGGGIDPEGEHIAAHDPAYVLADIAGKRLIIESFRWWWELPDQPPTDAELHARCSHPEWEYATTEGGRKTWADPDQPPEGDGWERNIDAGRDGWERFDYTEESYWRRRRSPEDIEQRRARSGRPPLPLRALALPFAQHADYQEGWKP